MYEANRKLVTKWLRNPPGGNSLHVSPYFPIRFLMFNLVLTQFLWVFPMFPLVFLPVSYFRSYVSNVYFRIFTLSCAYFPSCLFES